MARSFLTPIDLNSLELQNFRVHNLGTLPSATSMGGKLVFDTAATALKYSDGTSWQTIATGGSSIKIGNTTINVGGSTTSLAGASGSILTIGNANDAYTIWDGSTIAVNRGGTGTTTGSITGTGALTFTAGAGNNSINLVPTGTGSVYLGSTNGTNGFSITGLKDPSSALDAVNKQYVDGIASGINAHDAVKYATTANLGTTGNITSAGTITVAYNNGTSGVGAYITIDSTTNWTSITIDGQPLTVGDRVLIKNQGDTPRSLAKENGIYTVTTVGTTGNNSQFKFTRAADNDATPELGAGDLTYVISGDKNAGVGYVQTSTVTTIGTDAITWSQFSGASTTLAGAGLVTNGTNPNQLDVNVGAGLSIGGSGSDQVIITDISPALTTGTTYGGASQVGTFTVNSRGQIASVSNTSIGSLAASVISSGTLSPTVGGTGVNNGSSTITIGGNLTTSGAFATTLTVTATTSVTLPTSGTLMDNKMTTIGDILYASATGTPATYTRLAGNTATQPAFLSSTGNGTVNTTTAWTSSTGSGNVVLAGSPTISTLYSSSIIAPTSASLDLASAATSSVSTSSQPVSFKSGNATGTTSNSGSVTIDSGSATGTKGSLFLGNTYAPAITLGNANTTTTAFGTFGVRDSSAAFDLQFKGTSSTALTANRAITFDVINAARTVKLAGNIDLAANFTTSGANALTLTTTASTNVTLPTSGTLLTTAGSGSSLTFGTGSLSLAGNLTTSGAYATTLTVTGATTVTLPTSGTLLTTAGSGSSLTFGTGSLSLAGNLTTSGAYATTITTTGTTSITLPTSGTLATTGANTFTGAQTVQAAATQDAVVIQGRAGGTTSKTVTVVPATLTNSSTLTLPDAGAAAQTFAIARVVTGTSVLTANTSTDITHNLANQYVHVQMFDSTNILVDMDVTLKDANTITVKSVTGATYRYVIIG